VDEMDGTYSIDGKDEICLHTFQSEDMRVKKPHARLGVDGRMILKWFLKE
jgi:hypothetical protein